MSEPTDTGSTGTGGSGATPTGPAPKGSAPAPVGSGGSSAAPTGSSAGSSTESSAASSDAGASTDAPTRAFPTAQQHRAEGQYGGVATAHSGGAAGEAAPMVPPAEREERASRERAASTHSERRGPMESVLVLRRIDPWSAFTTVLGLMFALYLVWMVAIGVVYLLLSGMGVWDRLGGLLSGVAGDASASAVGPSTIFLYAGGVGLLNVLLLSILTTLAVFIYNLAADLTGGGVQVTLGDRRR